MALENEKFASLNDLYNRLLPALKTKSADLKREKLNISEKDIWSYCLKNKWSNKTDLRMHELVDDILNVDAFKLEIYLKKNIIQYEEI